MVRLRWSLSVQSPPPLLIPTAPPLFTTGVLTSTDRKEKCVVYVSRWAGDGRAEEGTGGETGALNGLAPHGWPPEVVGRGKIRRCQSAMCWNGIAIMFHIEGFAVGLFSNVENK